MNVNTNSSVVLTSLKHEYDPLDPQILLWMDLTFFFYIWQKKGLLKIKYREVCGFSRGVTIISKKRLADVENFKCFKQHKQNFK